jgi:hypothetical protein
MFAVIQLAQKINISLYSQTCLFSIAEFPVSQAVKQAGASCIGALGICCGAFPLFHLLTRGDLASAALCHPTFLTPEMAELVPSSSHLLFNCSSDDVILLLMFVQSLVKS